MATSTAWFLYALLLKLMILFNITGNSVVCILIFKNKELKSSGINWLLFHLAIADLLVAVLFIPPCVLSHFIDQPGGRIGDVLCMFITAGTLGWAATAASSFLLVTVSFERYYATIHPFRSLGRRLSWWLVLLLWILALLLELPALLVTAYDVENQICVENFPDYTAMRTYYIIWSFCNAVLPICIMGYLYAKIIVHLNNRAIVPSSSRLSVSQSRKRVTKMLIAVTVIFIFCWIPQAVICVLSPMVPGGYATVYPVATASTLLNSCVNPLVYTLHSQQFRKNLALLIRCYKIKAKTKVAPAPAARLRDTSTTRTMLRDEDEAEPEAKPKKKPINLKASRRRCQLKSQQILPNQVSRYL